MTISPHKKVRVKKTMEFDPLKLKKVRHILGALNDTQAIDQALSLVITNEEIQKAIREAFGSLPDFEMR